MVSMRFGALSPKKNSKPPARDPSPPEEDPNSVSPELLPIVTLISAQAHRRYHEGIFMLYYDLNGDGKPGDRKWLEVYGILTGNQLAYWDAGNLAKFKDSPEKLLETSSKPNYLNFTDAMFNAMAELPAAKQSLENVIIVSTTLKNRYIIQLRSYDSLTEWYLALRLATFEYSSLQEAYTGALLSARGSRLSDIKTILAEKRFNHEDWVKVRYGSGMAWRRYYAVIEPSSVRKKSFVPGRMLLYESENVKKKNLIGVITEATSVTAVYPQSHFFIDKSTIMKLEGSINFKSPSVKRSKKADSDVSETSLFIMPEQHSSVPGFDTLIRFLIPLFDAFGLYGRPKRLKADRVDPDSLVFGLPTLPHVHYLNVDDAQNLVASSQYLSWDQGLWKENFKKILRSKLAQGYDGCGSSRGFSGALNSLSNSRVGSPISSRIPSASPHVEQSQLRSASGPLPKLSEPLHHPNNSAQRVASAGVAGMSRKAEVPGTYVGAQDLSGSGNPSGLGSAAPIMAGNSGQNSNPDQRHNRNVNNLVINTDDQARKSVQLADIYHKYSKIQTPSDRFDDRNKILNGSAEEIDEDVLPSLIRKKSLMHGGIYPSSEKHLIESSDSEAEEDDEDDESGDSIYKPEGPLNSGALKVPQYENRNSSYSSVQSPLTQYSEFNKQFTEAVERPNRPDMHTARYGDEESSESEYSDSQSPPPVPSHWVQSGAKENSNASPKQLPQIQQLSSLHAPQTYNKQEALQKSQSGQLHSVNPSEYQGQSPQEQMYQQSYPKQSSVQKSQATTNLASALNSTSKPVSGANRPHYISSPNSSQNQLPRFDSRQTSPPQVAVTGPQQSQPSQQASYQAGQQPSQQRQAPQKSQQQGFYQAGSQGRHEADLTGVGKSESPTIAPTSAFRVQPLPSSQGQYRPQQGQQPQASHNQSRHPYAQRVDQGPQQQINPSQNAAQSGYPSGQYGQQRPQQQGRQQAVQQQQPVHQQQHAHQQQQAPQQYLPQTQAMPRQQSVPAQNNLRSYDSSQQMYQVQVQPNFAPRQQYPQQGQQQGQRGQQYQQFNQSYQPRQGQQQQQQQQQQQDPRYISNPSQGYMRKY